MNKGLQKNLAKPGPRFFYPGNLGNGSEVRLPPEAAHHAARVLRLTVGHPIVLFNGRGGEFEARITRIGKGDVAAKTGARIDLEREAPISIVLAQGLSSGDRMDLTLQKSVELGVTMIQPLATERSVVKLSAERATRRGEHWQNLVISACEQSGRNRVPEVAPIARLENWLAQLPRETAESEKRILLSPTGEYSLKSIERGARRIVLLAGPEGGLAPAEETAVMTRGFVRVRLGPRVLRTETAALAAIAAIQALWGDF